MTHHGDKVLAGEAGQHPPRLLEGLEAFDRHNIVTSAVYPWISQRLMSLKSQLEKDITTYRFSDHWEKKCKYQKASCRREYDWICPDGIIFKKAVDMR